MGIEFDYVAADTLQMFKIKATKVKVTALHNVSAVNSLKSGTDRLTEFKLLVTIITVRRAACDTCSRSLGQIDRK